MNQQEIDFDNCLLRHIKSENLLYTASQMCQFHAFCSLNRYKFELDFEKCEVIFLTLNFGKLFQSFGKSISINQESLVTTLISSPVYHPESKNGWTL